MTGANRIRILNVACNTTSVWLKSLNIITRDQTGSRPHSPMPISLAHIKRGVLHRNESEIAPLACEELWPFASIPSEHVLVLVFWHAILIIPRSVRTHAVEYKR